MEVHTARFEAAATFVQGQARPCRWVADVIEVSVFVVCGFDEFATPMDLYQCSSLAAR
jgi:hypothetical protein